MKVKSFWFGFIAAFIFFSTSAEADGVRNRAMSQLDFDRQAEQAAKAAAPTKDQINVILSDDETPAKAPAVAKPAPEVSKAPAAQTSETAKSTARASLAAPEVRKPNGEPANFDWRKPEEGSSHFLIPRLKGPFVDQNDKNAISTSESWKKGKGGCADVHTEEALAKKSRSLKELMSKFTGNDDFFESQCPQNCLHTDEIAVLTAFAVKTVPDGEYKMAEANGNCSYQIRSTAQPAHWQMLEGERGVCSCLPKSALQ